jgi:diguanylate cyclase (GGDEF)-like protein
MPSPVCPINNIFLSTLESVLGLAERNSQISVYKVDLNGLAVVNDGFGREIGDQLLVSIAHRLREVFDGEKATVARLGSDEFAILVESSLTTRDVAALAASITTEIAKPVCIQDYRLAVSACVGLVEHHGAGGEPAALLRAAEAELHRVKRSGQRPWGSLDRHRDPVHRARCRLAATLPDALESGEVMVDFQPLTRLTDGAVIAVEALLRREHPHHGSLGHQECLDLAARTGVVVSLGRWLLHRGCAQLASWRQRFGAATPRLHVDLTVRQSQDPDLVAGVRGALADCGIGAGNLQLGMPARALDTDPGSAEDNLRMLAEIGVAIVLLGFSGICELAHLENLPVRTAEMTKQVVRHLAQRPDEGCGVSSAVPVMLRLAHNCGATVLVRGIKTQPQAQWWRSSGADIGQGEFCAPAGAPEQVAAFVDSRRSGGMVNPRPGTG